MRFFVATAAVNTSIQNIQHLRELFGCEVEVLVARVVRGAVVTEKRFIHNRPDSVVDSTFSTESAEWRNQW